MNQETENKPADQDSMVLRTVYFPVELDEELKKLAFHRSTSKGDLIRRAVRKLVAELEAVEAAQQAAANPEVQSKSTDDAAEKPA